MRISPTVTYEPDALVYCGPRLPPRTLELSYPMIIVEVLSSSTEPKDRGDKLRDYLTLPSLAHYLLVDTERRQVEHYVRGEDGAGVLAGIVASGELELSPPGITIAVAELFAAG